MGQQVCNLPFYLERSGRLHKTLILEEKIMKKKKMIYFLTILLFVMSSHARATIIWSDWTEIAYLYPTSSHLMFITVYKNTSYSTCDNGGRFALNIKNPDYKTQAAALISAFATGNKINMAIIQAPTACNATIDRFMVR